MSSINNNSELKPIEQYGIAKYHTRIKVVINGHQYPEQMDVSDDCTVCSLSKNIKGAGQANFTLLPSVNYLNRIFPNDYVNIYFDIGDGLGWTRTFFGLVDRIEESYGVDDNGTPNTSYAVMCTDFSKVVTRTEIYFNPQISQRRDLNGLPFGTLNVGGLALMTSGIAVKGSPDTIVTVNLILTLGFGTQFMMPKSYPVAEAIIKQARADRTRAAYRLIQNKITPSNYNVQKARIEALAATDAQQLINSGSQEEIVRNLAQRYNLNINNLEVQRIVQNQDQNALAALISDQELRKLLGVEQSIGTEVDSFIAVDRTANPNQQPSLLDYVDLFTFVERESMDGYTSATAIWQQQGPIQSFLTSYSNEIVNEMFFDLRPRHMNDLSGDTFSYKDGLYTSVSTDAWDRDPDDIKGNIAGNSRPNSKDGIKYVPALVMREYPFSTISDLDASSVPISISARQNNQPTAQQQNQENSANNVETVGNIFLGAVFSDRPNVAGRHYISTPNINIEDVASNTGQKVGRRILDVAVISEKEIRASKLSRSDEDHVNLIEMWSDSALGSNSKWFMQDLSPIVTPIHIMKNGLRRRTLSTIFARLDRSATQNTAPTPAQQAAAQQAQQVPQSTETQDPVFPTGSIVWPALTVNGSGNPIKPVSSPYGYRAIKTNPSEPGGFYFSPAGDWVASGTPGAVHPTKYYTFHNGIDIPGAAGTPIYASMDGEVIIVGYQGMYEKYGNIVVIKHTSRQAPHEGMTVYAHLQSIDPSISAQLDQQLVGVPANDRARKAARWRGVGQSRAYSGNGLMNSIPVKAGQVIGTMGGTANISGSQYAPHLHFEFTTKFPSKPVSTLANKGPIPILSGDLPSSHPKILAPLTAGAGSVYSRDPMTFLRLMTSRHKAAPNDAIPTNNDPGTPTQIEDQDDDSIADDNQAHLADNRLNNPTTTLNPDGTQATNPNAATGQVPSNNRQTTPAATPAGQVMDGISGRRQLARWIILQDHWYQHNLEYLSGSFETSPHPEIRVGYRLDVVERNMSFYVEGVAHQWKSNEGMTTSLTVTRGQPNNPFPVYIHPATDGFNPADNQRKLSSRLSESFLTPDPVAIRNALIIRENPVFDNMEFIYTGDTEQSTNETDTTGHLITVNHNEMYSAAETDYIYNPEVTDAMRRGIDDSVQTGRNGGVSDQSTGSPQGIVPTTEPAGIA